MTAPLISARGMSCGYAKRVVLRGVDLALEPGEMVGVCGVNGSGKSTLLRTLSGAFPPRGGELTLNGTPSAGLTAKARAKIAAVMPQNPELGFGLSCFSMVLLGRYPHLGLLGGYGKHDQRVALEAMERTGCRHLAERTLTETSGGERARVFLARVLAQEPRVLLLDEPTSSLDPCGSTRVLDLVRDLCRDGAAALLALHDLNLAALYCDRLVFLQQGRIAVQGLTKDVFNAQTLASVFDTELAVIPHPLAGAPQALPVPGPGSIAGDPRGDTAGNGNEPGSC